MIALATYFNSPDVVQNSLANIDASDKLFKPGFRRCQCSADATAVVPEPLSMAAQSLVARDSTDPSRVRRLTRLLLKLGLVTGITLAAVIALIMTKLPWLFTSDKSVAADLGQLVVQAMCSTLLCSVVMMFDGISIGSNDFRHLPQTNLFGWIVTVVVLLVGRRFNGGLGSVWWSLSLFFVTRLAWHVLHIYRHWATSAFGKYHRPSHQEEYVTA